MKIKRVEIHGFKSFVERASLDFEQGITAVLGPNGCGKSNIVDAIRWVMGEQNAKHLRGRSMEDVIFGGSESRKPLGMAEVTMIFANEDGLAPAAFRDYAEIMVSRRLYRNGDSEYLLNKTPCRLKDITELFMDTGVGARAYSIIEQGKIGMILNAKPEDRRSLIEEAAGVTKYKSRKKTALRKIDATRQNLLRLGDIVGEVRRQTNSLKRQAQKAERYREYRNELKHLEVGIACERFVELQEELGQTADLECRQKQLVVAATAGMDQGEVRLEEQRLQQVAAEQQVNRQQEQVFHLTGEIQRVEGRIGFGIRELEGLVRRKEQLADEVGEVAARLSEAQAEEGRLKEGHAGLGVDLESETRRLAEAGMALEELTSGEQDLGSALEEGRRALYSLLTELSQLGARCDEGQKQLSLLEDRFSRNRNEAVTVREQSAETRLQAEALSGGLAEVKRTRDSLQQEREELRESLVSLRRRVEETEVVLLTRREELNRCRSRLESLEQLEKDLEGYGSGVKALLGDESFKKQFAAVAADLFDAPPRYEVALESVLGERLQALVAASGKNALEALEFLRAREGRCTLLLPVPPPAAPDVSSAAVPGAVPLADLVMPHRGHEGRVGALLAGFCFAESIEPFLAQRLPPGVTVVSEGGDLLSFRGELTGGGKQGLGQGLLHKKREMKELAGQVAGLSAEVDGLQQLREDLRGQLGDCEERLREVETALHRQELKVVDSEKDLTRFRENLDRLQDRLEVLSLEEDQLHDEREEISRGLERAGRERTEKEVRKLQQEEVVARMQEELQVQRRELEVLREQVTAIKVSVASIREREEGSRAELARLARLQEDLRARQLLLAGRQQEGGDEEERLAAEGERLRTELDVLFRRREEEKERLDRLRERFDEGQRAIEAQQGALKEMRGRQAQAQETLSALQLKLRELALEAEHLQQLIYDRYHIDLADAGPPSVELPERESVEKRLQDLRRLIEGMGEVSLTAIEEFRELEERGEFLTRQQDDLRQSLDGLQAAISKINRTTRRRFRETFDLVNEKFQEIFPRLFRGGRAELKLTDEDDLLETGIDIIVQPPGKKLQSVNLLSGGEKALTAVALIFSIFLIKPSPFCMLDEVDAPLDEANIGRFNEMVREMSDISQFIIITHNKRTMEIADTLYGVTMEEPGVSKLVSVRFNDFQV